MLSNRLKEARKRKKLTQEDLAKIVNTKKTTISNYETGYSTPSNEMLSDLADALDVTTDYLLGRTDKSKEISDDNYDSMKEINNLIKEYGIEHSGFFDIDKWKSMGPDEIKELESYFQYISEKAKKKNNQQD